MSLGIKSLWRARSRCCNSSGLSLISRDLVPSRVPRPLSGHLCLQFKSTARPSVLSTDDYKPVRSNPQKLPSRAQLLKSLGLADTSDGQVEERKDARQRPKNKIFKDAFRLPLQELEDHVSRNLHKSFVSNARKYPNHAATQASLREHLIDTRRQVGHSIVWEHFDTKMVEWSECFNLMKEMTPKWSNRTDLSAVRIVLPKSWDIEVNNQNLEYVDSATGVLRKLRTSVDMNPSAIVLRGKSSVLAAAADEIVRFCKQAEVYELGELDDTDYKTKQLWPAIETPDGDSPLSEERLDNIWVHKEYQPHTLAIKYEDVPKPAKWTMENFEKYIATLTYGRIPADLAISLYAKPGQFGRRVDTEGIRIRLIMEAFEDITAQPFITSTLLKMALSSMASRGGHRSQASRLVELAETCGVPMDTDVLNIMLESYVTKHDATFFYKFLRRMKTRYHHLNIRTWLLFLQLTKREDEKRQVVVAMYELGMFNHTETRRGIAEGLASFDAYAAFKSGATLDSFLRDQEERYGSHWISVEAVNKIIVELLRFHRKESPRLKECKRFIEMQQLAGRKCDLITINTALREAAAQRDWTIAHWAMSLFDQFGCEPDQETYQHLMKLCIDSHSPHALGTLYFYGVLDRKLATRSREMLREVLLRTHEHSFWKRYQPGIFPKDVLKDLYEHPIGNPKHIMSRIERVILEKWHGYTPTKSLAYALQLAYKTNDMPLRSQISAGRHDPKVRVLALKLKRTDGKEGKIVVRIVATFKPERMIRQSKKKGATQELDNAPTELSEHLEEEDLIEDPWEEESTDYVDLDTIRIIEEKLAGSNKSSLEKATKADSKTQGKTTVVKDESSQTIDAAGMGTLQREPQKLKKTPSKTVEVD